MTAKELAKKEGVTVRAIGIPFAKFHREGNPLFPVPFSQELNLSEEQIAALRPRRNAANGTRNRAAAHAAGTAMIDEGAGRPKEAAPNAEPVRRWPLWCSMAITAGASVPNMAEVTMAMKGSGLVGWSLTAAFTVVPFLLIMARISGFFGWMVVVGVMAYTAFCNTSAIFGGLTSLDSGYVLKPTVFLEAVTNLLNTDYLNTARTLSALMALLVGAIEFVAFKNLSK